MNKKIRVVISHWEDGDWQVVNIIEFEPEKLKSGKYDADTQKIMDKVTSIVLDPDYRVIITKVFIGERYGVS